MCDCTSELERPGGLSEAPAHAPGSVRGETFRVGFHSASGLLAGRAWAGLFVSVRIITSLFSFFAGSTHFFKGLGTEDFLKSFHEFRAFRPI